MLSSSRRKEEDVIDRLIETQMKLDTSLNVSDAFRVALCLLLALVKPGFCRKSC